MIARYSRPEMVQIWSEEEKYRLWFEIECLALEAMEKSGRVPAGSAAAIRKAPLPAVARVAEIEKETRHDVLAFLTAIAEKSGEEARFLHQGLTSSDILDTAFNLQCKQAGELLLGGLERICTALAEKAETHIETLCAGRSHGIHAEPTSFGLKLLSFYAEFARGRERLRQAVGEISTCAISGPVGTFASIDPAVEAHIAEKLGLEAEPVSTQVIPRDRHAMFFAVLAVIAGAVERFSVEMRHLQRTELGEALEPFGAGQKGSSAMPHKRNPILTENLTGLARIVRAYVIPALENIALWHERDISHSSVERIAAPDATITLDFALHRLAGIIEGMDINAEKMRQNLEASGWLPYSHAILLAMTQKGMAREEAYRIVQKSALAAEQGAELADALAAEPAIAALLSKDEIAELLRPEHYLRHAPEVLARVLKRYKN